MFRLAILLKKRQVFSCEFCKNLQSFFTENLWTAVSVPCFPDIFMPEPSVLLCSEKFQKILKKITCDRILAFNESLRPRLEVLLK